MTFAFIFLASILGLASTQTYTYTESSLLNTYKGMDCIDGASLSQGSDLFILNQTLDGIVLTTYVQIQPGFGCYHISERDSKIYYGLPVEAFYWRYSNAGGNGCFFQDSYSALSLENDQWLVIIGEYCKYFLLAGVPSDSNVAGIIGMVTTNALLQSLGWTLGLMSIALA